MNPLKGNQNLEIKQQRYSLSKYSEFIAMYKENGIDFIVIWEQVLLNKGFFFTQVVNKSGFAVVNNYVQWDFNKCIQDTNLKRNLENCKGFEPL